MGLYWAYEGKNGQQYYCKANVPTSQQFAGCANFHFNPDKPTVIFIPGWQPYSTYYKYKSEFYSKVPQDTGVGCNYGEANFDQLQGWKDKGWNVGIFYWNQLADETITDNFERPIGVMNAQAKIWVTNGPKKMRWRYYKYIGSGKYKIAYNKQCTFEGKPCPPVKNILLDEYVQALKNYSGNIRIVGHSLGGQLAIAFINTLTTQVQDRKLPPNLLPTRLSLLDPYFSIEGTKYFQDQSPLTVASGMVKKFIQQDGLIIDMYLSSDLTLNDDLSELASLATTIWLYPEYYSKANQPGRHGAAWSFYALSKQFNPPYAYVKGIAGHIIKSSYDAASASTSDREIAALMGGIFQFDQFKGLECMLPEPQIVKFIESSNDNGEIYAPVTKIIFSGNGLDNKVMDATLNQKFIKINATAFPANATNPLILWQSSDPKTAKVFPGGYIELLKAGTVTITAIAPSGMIESSGLLKTFVHNPTKDTIKLIIKNNADFSQ